MKKLSIAAVAALTIASAAPAVAQENVAADPFVATNGDTTALAVIGGVTLLVLIASASGDKSSSGTGTK